MDASSLALPFALCALCRQALASGGNSGLVQGFYWSIALMTSVPLLIMAVAAGAFWRHRRTRQADGPSASKHAEGGP